VIRADPAGRGGGPPRRPRILPVRIRPAQLALRLARRTAARARRIVAEPAPCPDGWRTAPPDFVGVGVERAGTTWWFELLADHPAVHQPARVHRRLAPFEQPSRARSIPAATAEGLAKELRFFDSLCEREPSDEDLALYRRFFPRPEGAIAGEWTPRYLLDFWTPPLLAAAAPDARILVLLRDPVERFRSGLGRARHEFNRRGTPMHLGVWNNALERGRYASQLERLFESFDRDRVLVLQYERCLKDPGTELRRTYEFLGLDEAGHAPAGLHARTEARLSAPPVPEHVRRGLASMLGPEVRRAAELCPELDIGLWPNFSAADL
jgi:hypothetical protein